MARDDDHPERLSGPHRYGSVLAGDGHRQEPTLGTLQESDLYEYEETDLDADYLPEYPPGNDALEYLDDDEPEDETFDLFDDKEPDVDYEDDMSGENAFEEDETMGGAYEDAESEDWDDSEEYVEEQEGERRWPTSLVAVAVVAVFLLAAGGYGVLQQRAATEAELRDLRAALATASPPADLSASREALATLQESYDKLVAEAEALTLENRRLADTVAGLESQLGELQAMPRTVGATTTRQQTTSTAPSTPATPAAPPQPPAPPQPAAPPGDTGASVAVDGVWFVNFGSYASRGMADSWAARLRPGAGRVIVTPITRDGQTLYRVRVVELADRDAARAVARKLESELRVSELWVGQD